MEKIIPKIRIKNPDALVTPYKQTRAGFIALALEKNKCGTPYVEEAKALKIEATKAKKPVDLLKLNKINSALLTAAGVSTKATNHLSEEDKTEAIRGLIDNFLEPSGKDFIDELIYRFLLTKGDSLGGSMRNLAGKLGEKKFLRAFISSLSIRGINFTWLDNNTSKWLKDNDNKMNIEASAKAIAWQVNGKKRVLILNIVVPLVKNNIDLSLLNCSWEEISNNSKPAYYYPEKFIALGELKGGIDPAGADEHWKTANSALDRIRKSFSSKKLTPHTFFVGAAIEKAMAVEIFEQLQRNILNCAGNLTIDEHLISVCSWLIDL